MPVRVAVVDPRRHVPRTDVVLADPRLAARRAARRDAGRRRRSRRRRNWPGPARISPASVADAAVGRAARRPPTSLHPGVNATGVLVHTNLGRAPLSAAARDAVQRRGRATPTWSSTWPRASAAAAARARSTRSRRRSRRPGPCTWSTTTPPRWSLAATALAAGREIIVSRGELIEIGDGFRLPDLLQSTGARIREVGTTNRTALRRLPAGDRRRHRRSSSRCTRPTTVIEGFTASVGVAELAEPRGAGGRRHRLRPARGRTRCSPTSPTPTPGCAPAPGWSRPAATSCSAGRRPGLLLGAPDTVTRLAPPPAGPGAAGGQADPGRAGGHPGRPGRRRSPQALTRDAGVDSGRGPRPWPSGWPARASTAEAVPRDAAVGGGGGPGVRAAQRRAVPARAAGRRAAVGRGGAPRRRARGGRPDRGRAAPARPARRRARRRRAAGARPCSPRGTAPAGSSRARRRDRRSCGPRQVDAGARADRDGAGPLGGGAAPRA